MASLCTLGAAVLLLWYEVYSTNRSARLMREAQKDQSMFIDAITENPRRFKFYFEEGAAAGVVKNRAAMHALYNQD